MSSKLRAAYETDLQVVTISKSFKWFIITMMTLMQAMAPQSVMFPGLHPAAMMATVSLYTTFPTTQSPHIKPLLWRHISKLHFEIRAITGRAWLPPPSWGPLKLSPPRPWRPPSLSRVHRRPWSVLKTPSPTGTSGFHGLTN